VEGERSAQDSVVEERVDAFVFVREVAGDRSFGEVVDELEDRYGENPEGPIVFLGEFLGEFRVCVHVAGPSLGDVIGFIGRDLWAAGLRSKHAVEKTPSYSPMGPVRRSPKPPHLLLVQIDLEPGVSGEDLFGAIREIGDGRGVDTYASAVYGDFDVLLEVGAGDGMLQDVLRFEADLRRVEGIAAMTSAIAFVSP
jgi:hypothetical protein